MLQGRTLQIKMVKDTVPQTDIPRPKDPENSPEAIALEVMTQTVGAVVVGYTICKSVDFFFRMAEHVIVRQ
jgi:hypothetical protein